MDARVGTQGFGAVEEDRIADGVLGFAVAAVAVVDAALMTRGHVLAGAVADGALLVAVLNFAAWRPGSAGSLAGPSAIAALRAVAVVALARVVAAGMPVSGFSEPVADLMVALPVGYAAIRFAPFVGVSIRGLIVPGTVHSPSAGRRTRTDAAVVAAGGALGVIAYLLGAPALASASSSPGRVVLAIAAVTATVVVEELVFRGLLQSALQRVAGRAGLLAAAMLFACAYLAAGSAELVLTLACAAVVFALGFARSGNLRSAIAGHYLLAIGAFVVCPVLFGRSGATWLEGPVTTVVLAVAVIGATAAAVRQPLAAVRP